MLEKTEKLQETPKVENMEEIKKQFRNDLKDIESLISSRTISVQEINDKLRMAFSSASSLSDKEKALIVKEHQVVLGYISRSINTGKSGSGEINNQKYAMQQDINDKLYAEQYCQELFETSLRNVNALKDAMDKGYDVNKGFSDMAFNSFHRHSHKFAEGVKKMVDFIKTGTPEQFNAVFKKAAEDYKNTMSHFDVLDQTITGMSGENLLKEQGRMKEEHEKLRQLDMMIKGLEEAAKTETDPVKREQILKGIELASEARQNLGVRITRIDIQINHRLNPRNEKGKKGIHTLHTCGQEVEDEQNNQAHQVSRSR